MKGCICRTPIFHKTQTGKEITQTTIVIDGKYIECIITGKKARIIAECKIGDKIYFEGEIKNNILYIT